MLYESFYFDRRGIKIAYCLTTMYQTDKPEELSNLKPYFLNIRQ